MTLMRDGELDEILVEGDYSGGIRVACLTCKEAETIVHTGGGEQDLGMSLMEILKRVGNHYATRHEADNRMARAQAELDKERK